MKSTLRRWLTASSLLALIWGPNAAADETDWLYFPMYARDTAHAVDLQALRWRPDGLLASATRYPRHSGEPWTEEESSRGWYNYERRLIDCSLGFYVSTDIQLLARDGTVIASRSYAPAEWVDRLEGQLLESRQNSWPQGNEILLACAAASSPDLKARRARMARKVSPLITFKPITQDLAAESADLMGLARPNLTREALRLKPGMTAAALFDRMRRQYADWRRSVAGPHAGPADPTTARRNEVERLFGSYLQQATAGRISAMRLLPSDVLEYSRALSFYEFPELRPGEAVRVGDAYRVARTERLDCQSGVVLPVAWVWRGRDEQVLLTRRASAEEAFGPIGAGYRDAGGGWDLRWGGWSDATLPGALCQALFRLKAGREPAGEPTEERTSAPFGLTAQRLMQQGTPEAMLLAIRAAWRADLP